MCFAEKVQGWVDSAVGCVWQVVFIERVVISTRDLFYVVSVLRLLWNTLNCEKQIHTTTIADTGYMLRKMTKLF